MAGAARRGGVGALGAGIALLLASSATGGSAPPTSDPAPIIDPGPTFDVEKDPSMKFEVDEFARQFDVIADDAARILMVHHLSNYVGAELVRQFPETFAGIWFDESSVNKIQVGIRNADDEVRSIVTAIATVHGIGGDVEVVSVQYSLGELDRGHRKVEELISRTLVSLEIQQPITAVNFAENRVIVRVDPALEDDPHVAEFVSKSKSLMGEMLIVEYEASDTN